jgi:transposase
VCDDFSGYKACFEMGVTEAGCLAHARRKFHELWVNHQSTIGERALKFFIELYDIEREVHELDVPMSEGEYASSAGRWPMRCTCGWTQQRKKVPEGSATIKAIDYSLKRWTALTRYHRRRRCPRTTTGWRTRSGRLRIGRSNWLFAGRCARANVQRR